MPIGGIDREIALGVSELLQKPVLENVDFIEINCSIQLDGMVRGITDLKRCILRDLPLISERPLLHIGSSQVRINRPQRVVWIGYVVRPVGEGYRKVWRRKRHASTC